MYMSTDGTQNIVPQIVSVSMWMCAL